MPTIALAAIGVLIWGSTYLAITFQVGQVAPEVSVLYRFLLASALLFAWCGLRGLPLRFQARQHAWLAALGIPCFSLAYIFVYHAERHVASGLVAIGYSATPAFGMVGARLFFRTPITRETLTGSALGIAGIGLVFAPEFASVQSEALLPGIGLTLLAVLMYSGGTLISQRNQRLGWPLWSSMAWAMAYGATFSLVTAIVLGRDFAFPFTAPYVLSLLHLSLLGSVVAFGAYFTLVGRVGAATAGYVNVMTPIVALLLSSLFEGFRWQALTLLGITLSIAGNVIILRNRQAPARWAAPSAAADRLEVVEHPDT